MYINQDYFAHEATLQALLEVSETKKSIYHKPKRKSLFKPEPPSPVTIIPLYIYNEDQLIKEV